MLLFKKWLPTFYLSRFFPHLVDQEMQKTANKKIIYLRNKFEKNIYVLDSEQILNKEAELNAERIINGRKIETFEKEKIMNFMEENRMHNYYYVYNIL